MKLKLLVMAISAFCLSAMADNTLTNNSDNYWTLQSACDIYGRVVVIYPNGQYCTIIRPGDDCAIPPAAVTGGPITIQFHSIGGRTDHCLYFVDVSGTKGNSSGAQCNDGNAYRLVSDAEGNIRYVSNGDTSPLQLNTPDDGDATIDGDMWPWQ